MDDYAIFFVFMIIGIIASLVGIFVGIPWLVWWLWSNLQWVS